MPAIVRPLSFVHGLLPIHVVRCAYFGIFQLQRSPMNEVADYKESPRLEYIGYTVHVPYYIPNSRFNHTSMIGSGITAWRFSISISSFLTKARFTILTLADEPR